jgi:hypothetical protein
MGRQTIHMDAVERFIEQAIAYREWLLHGNDTGMSAAKNALLVITRLYLAGLELGDIPDEDVDLNVEKLSTEEMEAVYSACKRLPLDLYSEVFNPLTVPPEEPVVGSLTDDLSDIYHDVITWLRPYETGRRSDALWNWTFNLQIHWGEHATSAIRTLRCWTHQHMMDEWTNNAAISQAEDEED